MAAKLKNKPFKDWLYEEVNIAFGLTRTFQNDTLDFFKTLRLDLTHPKRESIEELRFEALQYVDSWNEDEYKFMFISPFFKLINFYSKYYKAFTQRPLSVTYENDTKITNGIVEFMLAKGIQIPVAPHFFLHEYKPEKHRDNDPLGQLLIAMIAAQKVNKDEKPIYGIYVNGRNWFFVILEGKEYTVSDAYDIAADEIFDLFAILLELKARMEEMYSTLV